MRKCTIRVAKTKALISFAVTAKLICAFVFAYADCSFSNRAAQNKCRLLKLHFLSMGEILNWRYIVDGRGAGSSKPISAVNIRNSVHFLWYGRYRTDPVTLLINSLSRWTES